MFPSSGLFAVIDCPFSKYGVCERPHCLYKHATKMRDMSGASYKSSFDCAGVHGLTSYLDSGTAVGDEISDVCLQELKRINREIETVRHEVEEEQRRLSRYQTVQADSRNTKSIPPDSNETARKSIDTGAYSLSSSTHFTNTYRQRKKYVVDNSKPRTDLEYDPLSNFSADLRSYSSLGKDQKVKKARNAEPCEQKKPAQTQLSRLAPPEPLDEWNEDDVLIIDIPPSPDKKGGQSKKSLESAADNFLQHKVEEIKEGKTAPVLYSPPVLCAKAEVCKVDENGTDGKCAENSKSNLYEKRECKNKPHDGCADLERERAESKVKSLKPASSALTDLQVDKEEHLLEVQLPHCEPPHSLEKMNPLHPHNFPQKNSLFYKAPAANLNLQCSEQRQKMEQPVQNRGATQMCATVVSVLPHCQKSSSKIPGLMQNKAPVNHALPESCLGPAGGVLSSSQSQAPQNLSCLRNAAESSASTQQILEKADSNQCIIIDSSSDDDFKYSDLELSDSDPMEECYRIFMEENQQKGNDETEVETMDMDKEFEDKHLEMPVKKRVAHEARYTETVAKSRPQPQVLVPLRGPVVSGLPSQPSSSSKIQQVQQRASILTSSVKGAQAFISSTGQRKPDAMNAPSPSTQTSNSQTQLAPLQNAFMNCLPLATTVIDVGNNLHLIFPECTFPVAASSSPVTSVLTPIGRVPTSTVTMKQPCHPAALNSLQRCRTTAPILIPAMARKPSVTPAFAATHSSPAASTAAPSAVHVPAKPTPVKRKLKQFETTKDKVPHDIRQRYVNMFTEEFLKTTSNVKEAFEKALAEERSVYNRSVNKLKYLSIAVNALKKLKNQSAVPAKGENEANRQRFRGNIPLNLKKCNRNDDVALYESLKDYILTEEKLIEYNYPVQHPEKPGCAALFVENKKISVDPSKRICCRCGATYSVNSIGKHIRMEECNYHYGKGITKKVPGGVETRYTCCEGVMGAPGCQVFKLHVHDSLSLDGFVSTVNKPPSDTSGPGVFSLDCEMCFTIHGLELSRVTLVNSSLHVIYDTFVRPDHQVIDYNTRFSGISEEDVKGNHTSLREVQEMLLSIINADTILIGHGLETDLCALKLFHGTVVDTSVVFPHHLGPPHKLTLKTLTAEYLRRIIQESVCGHDTAEDATACMELMLWKVKEDGKMKK